MDVKYQITKLGSIVMFYECFCYVNVSVFCFVTFVIALAKWIKKPRLLLTLIASVLLLCSLADGFQSPPSNIIQKVELHQQINNSQNDPLKRLLVIGCGNVANALLSELQEKMIFNHIICASRKGQNELSTVFDNVEYILSNQTSQVISTCSHVLVTVPPIQKNNEIVDVLLDDNEIMKGIRFGTKVSYVSTTGVYGDHENRWVDESSPVLCIAESKPSYYFSFEQRYQNVFGIENTSIFRCAGLYGDDFSALHTVLKHGGIEWLDQINGEDITSRVHLNDVARCILACMVQDQNGIFCVADDEPASRKIVMEYAYSLLLNEEIPLPLFETQNLKAPASDRSRRRIKDRKRVKNTRMKTVLANAGGLNFPSYKEGLKSVLDRNIQKWRKQNLIYEKR